MIGRIFKTMNGKYIVSDGTTEYTLVARGNLKKDGIVVGDLVEFDTLAINKVLDRKNKLVRPNVANVDLVVGVVSALPKPDFYLIDKVIINARHIGAEIILAVNKSDLGEELYEKIKREYKEENIKILQLSAKDKSGLDCLRQELKGKLTVLAGQSAAGKTSLVNALFGLNLKTGELAEKIGRGKHTTTASQIFAFEDIMLVDSPGFAVIDALVKCEELTEYYNEYLVASEKCRFRGCLHINEPDCQVKKLVSNGELSKERYQRYKEIYNEILKGRKFYE